MSAERHATSRWTLRFVDPLIEQAFQREQFDRLAPALRVGAALTLLMIAAIGPAERVLFPEVWRPLWAIRYGALVPVAVLLLGALSWPRVLPWVRDHGQLVLAAAMGLAFACLEGMALVLVEEITAERMMYFGLVYVVCIQTIYLVIRIQFVWAAFFGNLVLLASLAVVAPLEVDPFALWTTLGLSAMTNVGGLSAVYLLERASRAAFVARQQLEVEQARAEVLLRNILPEPISARLASEGRPLADAHPDVTVVFADLVGFTTLSARTSPERIVALLDALFSRLDLICEHYGAEKIKTIGDAYMAVVGLPDPVADHAGQGARLALAMQQEIQRVAETEGLDLSLRVGLHSGPVVAGVIGETRLLYDLWGDTVNVASRMESHGEAGRVQASAATAARLPDDLRVRRRGTVAVKGRGEMETWWVEAGLDDAELDAALTGDSWSFGWE